MLECSKRISEGSKTAECSGRRDMRDTTMAFRPGILHGATEKSVVDGQNPRGLTLQAPVMRYVGSNVATNMSGIDAAE